MAGLIEDGVYRTTVKARHRRGKRMRLFYFGSLVIAMLALLALLYNVVNGAFGLVAVTYEVTPEMLMARAHITRLVDDGSLDAETADAVSIALSEAPRLDEQTIPLILGDLVETGTFDQVTADSLQADLITRTLEGRLDDFDNQQLATILGDFQEGRLLVMVRSSISAVPDDEFTRIPLAQAIDGEVPPEYAEMAIVDVPSDVRPQVLMDLLATNASAGQLRDFIESNVLVPTVEKSWELQESLLARSTIDAEVAETFPEADVQWRSWVNPEFVSSPLSNTPADAGILPAILGTMWLMAITIIVALPLGVGAAIYLEEYASDNWLNRIIETNIRNLAGVPSIIYGMLGLAIFVRTFFDITSGSAFGLDNPSGRTILSAGMTLALLILPIIIINAQEALRAVPNSIREASYGLGATQWQTISRQVLPVAIPGIMTGTIIALSRAIGETAPLIVVGASTFITVNPDGPFSSFTALPILIYNWVSEPNDQFRNIAAAGILILLAMLLAMNSVAIIIRNRTSGKV